LAMGPWRLGGGPGGGGGACGSPRGAGVGPAGRALAVRVPGIPVTLVEIDAELAALAEENARRNGLADRVRAVALDVGAPARAFAAAGLGPGSAARVLMNPPFNDPGRARPSPDPGRRLAHAGETPVAGGVRCAARLLQPRGSLALIWRADGLPELLRALTPGFGAIAVLPVHPQPDAPAIRVLVGAEKGSGAPLVLLPGLALNDAAGRPSAAAEAVLREGASLSLVANTRTPGA